MHGRHRRPPSRPRPRDRVDGHGRDARSHSQLELAPIRVNLIAAGFVDTPLSASLLGDQLDERRNQLRATLPIGRVVGPDDVATLAVHVMTTLRSRVRPTTSMVASSSFPASELQTTGHLPVTPPAGPAHLSTPGLHDAGDTGDPSPSHGWNKQPAARVRVEDRQAAGN